MTKPSVIILSQCLALVPVCLTSPNQQDFPKKGGVCSPQSLPTVWPTMVNVDGNCLIPSYYYFWNLETNFYPNELGHCTWTAAEIYLAYLHVFKQNTVLPSNCFVRTYGDSGSTLSLYEESPGTWNGTSTKQYPKLQCFHTYFVDNYSNSTFTYPILPYNIAPVIGYSRQRELMSYYLEDRGLVLLDDFWIQSYTTLAYSEYFFDSLIVELRAGRPIIANTPDHSFVVYGYVPNTRKLIIHNGWSGGHSHDVYDFDAVENYGATGIQLAFSVLIYEHEHCYSYVDDYDAYCVCGDSVYTWPYYHKHTMALYWSPDPEERHFFCTICGYEADL